MSLTWRLGAEYRGQGLCRFLVWAPRASRVAVVLTAPEERVLPLQPLARGYHAAQLSGVRPGTDYLYRLDGKEDLPDPASRHQPRGVNAASRVVTDGYPWRERTWHGLPLENHVIYELHVGAFSPDGTFGGVEENLDRLRELGVTAVELMPVAQFPGGRNWGYDGVQLFAPQNTYGGPGPLKHLVHACHSRGLAVILDVVYNHLGPEGNHLARFGPYFSQNISTPWSPAVNFDGPDSDEVRRFFIENALHWLDEYRFDGLRLDALHAIYDFTATQFVEDLSRAVAGLAVRRNRQIHLFGESSRNDPRLVEPRECGGQGLDALWNDDFHHSLRVALTGQTDGYYQDFQGVGDLAKAMAEGFVYSGQYSPFRRRRHGRSAAAVPAKRLVAYAQNHDQVGNRMLGERLAELVDFESLKLAAAAVTLSPYLPLLFMGEEYADPARFPYFISHGDPDLVEQVRQGRRKEFAAFRWAGEPPDPQAPETFQGAKLRQHLAREGRGAVLHALYARLLDLRRAHPLCHPPRRDGLRVLHQPGENTLALLRRGDGAAVLLLFNFGPETGAWRFTGPEGVWHLRLDTSQQCWAGPGSLLSEKMFLHGNSSLPLQPRSVAWLDWEGILP